MNLRFGLLWPFRNPEFNRVPWTDLYRTHLDLIADSEAMGYDNAWLTEHHRVLSLGERYFGEPIGRRPLSANALVLLLEEIDERLVAMGAPFGAPSTRCGASA